MNTKTSGTSGAILTRLFRAVQHYVIPFYGTNQKTGSMYYKLMDDFLSDSRNCIGQNKKDRSQHRGNLAKELQREEMSWKVFTKGLRFLGVKKFEIKITAFHSDNTISEHTDIVNLGERVPYQRGVQYVPTSNAEPDVHGDNID